MSSELLNGQIEYVSPPPPPRDANIIIFVFNAIVVRIRFTGTIVAVWLMSVKLKMHDAAIGFIGSGFDLIAAVCYSFVTQPWQLYAGL